VAQVRAELHEEKAKRKTEKAAKRKEN